jgi:DNA replicative helicase MCM subunit Mcm2 (Cdc46/Mcm family)
MNASFLNQRVSIEGQILKTSTQYPFCTKAAFQCQRCGPINIIGQNSLKLIEPLNCENDTCGKKGPFKFIPEESTFIDAKEIEIYDKSKDGIDRYDELPNVRLKVILIGNIANIPLTDNNFIFTGKFTTSELGRKLEYILYADKMEEIVPPKIQPPKPQPVTIPSQSPQEQIMLVRNCIIEVSKKHPGKQGAPLEEIYSLAKSKHGIDRDNAENCIKKMQRAGQVVLPILKHVRLNP